MGTLLAMQLFLVARTTSAFTHPASSNMRNPPPAQHPGAGPRRTAPWSSSRRESSRRQQRQPPSLLLRMSVNTSKSGGRLIESSEEFARLVTSPSSSSKKRRPVLCFFTAPWCGPCRLSVPVVKDVLKQFSGKVDACEVCTDDLPDVASDNGVVSIPTIHLYYDGVLKDTLVGCVAKQVLAGSVEKVLEDIEAAAQTGGGGTPR